ncbi:hypothetical protein HYT95_02365 [Candidatus Peregrinibacteria bacterium]|nr:hypothetical protein [Candidatus Peregrinibacteria bacterium]
MKVPSCSLHGKTVLKFEESYFISRFVEQFMTRAAPATAGDAPVQLVMNAETRKDIRPVVTRLLSSAREHIVIEVSYISDPELLDLLVRRSHAGVRITMLLPKMPDFHHHANLLTIGKLLSEGRASHVHVLLYPGMFHAKALLIDGVTAFVGSANLFTASLDDMGEVNVLVRGKRRFLRTLRESMRRSILQSRPITSPPTFLWLSRWLAWMGL